MAIFFHWYKCNKFGLRFLVDGVLILSFLVFASSLFYNMPEDPDPVDPVYLEYSSLLGIVQDNQERLQKLEISIQGESTIKRSSLLKFEGRTGWVYIGSSSQFPVIEDLRLVIAPGEVPAEGLSYQVARPISFRDSAPSGIIPNLGKVLPPMVLPAGSVVKIKSLEVIGFKHHVWALVEIRRLEVLGDLDYEILRKKARGLESESKGTANSNKE